MMCAQYRKDQWIIEVITNETGTTKWAILAKIKTKAGAMRVFKRHINLGHKHRKLVATVFHDGNVYCFHEKGKGILKGKLVKVIT
jgi:hypothetical protein